MVDFILFPSSYYGVNYVDEDLQSEYDAVVATGLYETAFFSYDQWICEEKFISEADGGGIFEFYKQNTSFNVKNTFSNKLKMNYV